MLTDTEIKLVKDIGNLLGGFNKIIHNGPCYNEDLGEVVSHIHALQNMVMSQSAARAHPGDFRLMGGQWVCNCNPNPAFNEHDKTCPAYGPTDEV